MAQRDNTDNPAFKEMCKKDLRKEWRELKKKLNNPNSISDESKKQLKAATKKFESGLGKMIEEHCKLVEKLPETPKNEEKIKKSYDKIDKTLSKNEKIIKKELSMGSDYNKVIRFYEDEVFSIKQALKGQRAWFNKLKKNKDFFAEKT